MRLRTGHSPADWTANEPATVSAAGYRGASPIGAMAPVMRDIRVASPGEVRQIARRRERDPGGPARRRARREAAAAAKQLCGKTMPRTGQTCARAAGHRDSCCSREVMDLDMERRRTSPRGKV